MKPYSWSDHFDAPLKSYWELTAFADVDICIIGAGIIGLSTAIECRNRFKDASITVLERSPHGHGATTRNAGFACFGSASELLHDLDKYGAIHAFDIAHERFQGLKQLLDRCPSDALSYEPLGGYELIRESESHVLDRMQELNAFAQAITGDPHTFELLPDSQLQALGFSRDVIAVIRNIHEGQLHSGSLHALLEHIATGSGIRIEYGSNVSAIEDFGDHGTLIVQSAVGEYGLHSKAIILANNACIPLLAPDLPIKPGRGQVLVTTPIMDLPFQGAFHMDEGFYYFRSIGNRVLLGGGRNLDFNGEETYEFGHSDLIMNALNNLLHDVIIPGKEWSIEYAWSGLMGFTPDKKPIVKAISNHVYCAFGCNGMGIALGSRIASMISGMIQL